MKQKGINGTENMIYFCCQSISHTLLHSTFKTHLTLKLTRSSCALMKLDDSWMLVYSSVAWMKTKMCSL